MITLIFRIRMSMILGSVPTYLITLIGSTHISLILGLVGIRMTTLKKSTDTITILFKAIRMTSITLERGTHTSIFS